MTEEAEEFATIEALMTALYSSISGPPGGQDFELSRRACHPQARLVRTRLDESGKPVALSFSVDEYEANARALLADMPFHEVETGRRTIRFGNVAQVFSAYEARTEPQGGELIKRGMNCAHLFNDGARWWLMHMIWDDEREGVEVPRELFDRWEDVGV
ncbi:MAG TPA: hypothetical protein VFR28_02215 [Allosphingosinicella sp.]|jgi:hypothetical protein|nr:hypothetical protein [Allosphingosinicella sp.]